MRKLLKKIKFQKSKRLKIPPLPSWNGIVAMLYDKNLDEFDYEVVNVIYSKDKSMRYIILKSTKGFFTYRLKKIYQFNEEEWKYICNYDSCPGFWSHVENGIKSVFGTLEDVLNELKQDYEYKFLGFNLTRL